jgi:protein ImuA
VTLPLPLIDIANVWLAGEMGHYGGASMQTIATGYPALSRVLPGGGWPCGAMTEVLQAQPGQHEWGLVAPALGALHAASTAGLVVLVGAPYCPFGPALGARQINMQRLLSIHAVKKTGQNTGQSSGNTAAHNSIKSDSPTLLWATREALQCADVCAVLAWLPDARSAHLRRLQIAALSANKLLFVFRPLQAQHDASPAPLRLKLTGMAQAANVGMHNLQIDVFKRRGPNLTAPVLLDTRPPRLTALLAASGERIHQHTPVVGPKPVVFDLSDILRKPLHALDRTASLQH